MTLRMPKWGVASKLAMIVTVDSSIAADEIIFTSVSFTREPVLMRGSEFVAGLWACRWAVNLFRLQQAIDRDAHAGPGSLKCIIPTIQNPTLIQWPIDPKGHSLEPPECTDDRTSTDPERDTTPHEPRPVLICICSPVVESQGTSGWMDAPLYSAVAGQTKCLPAPDTDTRALYAPQKPQARSRPARRASRSRAARRRTVTVSRSRRRAACRMSRTSLSVHSLPPLARCVFVSARADSRVGPADAVLAYINRTELGRAIIVHTGGVIHHLPKKFGAPDHKTTRILVDTAAMGLVAVNDGHARLSTQFKELAEGVEARFIAFASEQREYVPGGTVLPSTFDTSIETALVSAVNKHTTNFGSMSQALNGGLARLAAAESSSNTIAAQITALTATVASFENALQTVLARTSAPSSSLDVVNTNGKRARLDGEVDGAAKRVHALVDVPVAYTYPLPPPAPALATPSFLPALPPASAPSALAAPPALVPAAPGPPPAPPGSVYPGPPPAPLGSAYPGAMPAPPGSAYPHPPLGGPPRAVVDPAREVHLGPMTWGKERQDWFQQPRQLINAVLGFATMRPVRYSSHKGHDDFTAVVRYHLER
ncbi:hypothetical protein GGX14DRAFT_581449 [Mycena pura]|uniref:Uncharacterized protein n=1 Tax=Mycena pura TaxID=153505 RepID=A0AAD7E5D0_9AGAR|nr:hypothetical protein GGX14DRAFT_581449 [Mycena pura]